MPLINLKINKMPMDNNSTLFLSFTDITVNEIDLFEDAFFSDAEYSTLTCMVSRVSIEPPPDLVARIIARV